MKPEIAVLPTAALASQAAADRFVAVAEKTIRARGEFVVALSGGSTPRGMYERIAAGAPLSSTDWSRVHVLWSDERCVPPDDAESNYRMAREALLDHVPIPKDNVHRVHGEDDQAKAAAAYETVIRGMFARAAHGTHRTPSVESGAARVPHIDLILLGLGVNGHTASLFPGAVDVHESPRLVMADQVDAVPAWRVTFTPTLINAAAEVHFLVTEGAKAAVLKDVLEGPRRPHDLPAQLVAPDSGRVTWFLDAAAAAALDRT